MVLMVFLLIPRPRSPSGSGFAHRMTCDDGKMGFRPRRDNKVLRHRIVAEIGGNSVSAVIDAAAGWAGHDPFRPDIPAHPGTSGPFRKAAATGPGLFGRNI